MSEWRAPLPITWLTRIRVSDFLRGERWSWTNCEMFPDASNFIRHFRTAGDPNGNVLTEPRHKPRNPLGSVSDMIECNGLSKLLEVGQQATFPLEYRKPVMTSAQLLLQPAANAGDLIIVFTNQK